MKLALYIIGALGIVKGLAFLLAPQFMIDTAEKFINVYPDATHDLVRSMVEQTAIMGLISIAISALLIYIGYSRK